MRASDGDGDEPQIGMIRSCSSSCSCSRMESERAAHTAAALALLPIRLRHKRSTFCACPREPFPSCQALNSRPCVFARRRCYSWTHYRPSVLRATAATPADFYVGKEKSESWQCCSTKKYHHKLLSPPTRSRTTTTTTPPRRSHGRPEEDAQVCADEASHW